MLVGYGLDVWELDVEVWARELNEGSGRVGWGTTLHPSLGRIRPDKLQN